MDSGRQGNHLLRNRALLIKELDQKQKISEAQGCQAWKSSPLYVIYKAPASRFAPCSLEGCVVGLWVFFFVTGFFYMLISAPPPRTVLPQGGV